MGYGIVYYEFDGSDGCDQCDSMTGYYDERPARPHPNCDCPITRMIATDYETIYKNKNVSGGSEEEDVISTSTFTNDGPVEKDYELQIEETVQGEISVDAEIEDIFSVSGTYTESMTISHTVTMTLQPGQSETVSVIGVKKHVEFSAERWHRLPNGREIFECLVTDEIETVEEIRID